MQLPDEYTHYRQADDLVKSGNYADAMLLFEKAKLLHPDHPDLLHDMAVCFFHMKKRKEALRCLDRAMELQPENPYRYASRGFIRAAFKDVRGAMADYQKALELDPEDAVTMNNMGLLEEQIGYDKEARERFKAADELMNVLNANQISLSEQRTWTSLASVSEEGEKEVDEEKPEPQASTFGHIRAVFTRKSALREFVNFVRRGFKLK
jgi:tetratricopeptide (TPR) repeat protein